MKNLFEVPEIEFISLSNVDVIVTSPCIGNEDCEVDTGW
jgi:hypothetical protein